MLDATNSTRPAPGRYVNDAPHRDPACSCRLKACYIDNMPRLLVYAKRNTSPGEELRYDYGTSNLPWRVRHHLTSITSWHWTTCIFCWHPWDVEYAAFVFAVRAKKQSRLFVHMQVALL